MVALFTCLDWNLFSVWNIICGFLFQNPTREYFHTAQSDDSITDISSHLWPQITKFGSARDIPKHFITKKVVQNGVIKSIEPNQAAGAILRVDHKPPINLLFASKKTLPVKVNTERLNFFLFLISNSELR